jgi:hypothetical protein
MKCNWMWVIAAAVIGWFAAGYYAKVRQGAQTGELVDNVGNIAEGVGGLLKRFKRN